MERRRKMLRERQAAKSRTSKFFAWVIIVAMVISTITLGTFNRNEVFAEETQEPGAGATVLDITQGDIKITNAGATGGGLAAPETALNPDGYIINGSGQETPNRIEIGQAGVEMETKIKLVNVSMKGAVTAKLSGITIRGANKVHLTLEGDNVIDYSQTRFSAVAIMGSFKGSPIAGLVVGGDGSLLAHGGVDAQGIGGLSAKNGDYKQFGSLTVNSGTIKAIANGDAAPSLKATLAGIGGSGVQGQSFITINGGSVEAVINSSKPGAAAIQLDNKSKAAQSMITINGGNVKAYNRAGVEGPDIGEGTPDTGNGDTRVIINGGSIDARVQGNPINGDMAKVYPVKVKTDPALVNKEVRYSRPDGSVWRAVTSDTGELNIFLPENTEYVAFNVMEAGVDTLYYKMPVSISNTGTNEYTMDKYVGPPSTCNPSNSSLDFQGQTVEVNKTLGYTEVTLRADFVKDPNCTYPIHTGERRFSFVGTVDPNTAVINGSTLIAKTDAIDQTLRVRVEANIQGHNYSAEADFSFVSNEKLIFDLSRGNIVVSEKDADNLTVTVGATEYTVKKDAPITIIQSDSHLATTPHTIWVKPGTEVRKPITLQEVDIKQRSISTGLQKASIRLHSPVEIKLAGTSRVLHENKNLSSPIEVYATRAKFSGDGKLIVIGDKDSANPALEARGDGSHITIEDCEVQAKAKNVAIGSVGEGIEAGVTITRAKVIAEASGYSADDACGIRSTGSARTTINSGYVEASGLDTKTNKILHGIMGNLEINGGSVKCSAPPKTRAVNKAGDPLELYVVTTEDSLANQSVDVTWIKEQSVEVDGDTVSFKTLTDSESKLYFYLPADKKWSRTKTVADNGTAYYKRVMIDNDNLSNNKGVAVKTSPKRITDLSIDGQESSVIDEAQKKITVKMKPGILLMGLWKINVSIEGSSYYPTEKQEIIAHDTVPLKYTVVGEDGSKVKYDVFVIPESVSPDSPMIIDVKVAPIVIKPDGVEIAGNMFPANRNGYILTGTVDSEAGNVRIEGNIDVPVDIKNLNIRTTGDKSPLEIRGKVEVTMNGEISLTATKDGIPAIDLSGAENSFKVLRGDNITVLTAGSGAPAIGTSKPASDSGDIKLKGMGTLNIAGGSFVANPGAGAPAVGLNTADPNLTLKGKWIIDSGSFKDNSAAGADKTRATAPENTSGQAVYPIEVTVAKESLMTRKLMRVMTQLVGQKIPSEDGQVFTDDEGKVYLYRAEGWTAIGMKEPVGPLTQYWNTVNVQNGVSNKMRLGMSRVKDLKFKQPESFKATDVKFEVLGENLGGNLFIEGRYNGDTANGFASITVGERAVLTDEGKYEAVIHFEENDHMQKDKVYNLNVEANMVPQLLEGKYDVVVIMPLSLKLSVFDIKNQLDLEDPNPHNDPNIKEFLVNKTIFGTKADGTPFVRVKMPYDYMPHNLTTGDLILEHFVHNGKSTMPFGLRDNKPLQYTRDQNRLSENRLTLYPTALPDPANRNFKTYSYEVVEQARPIIRSIEIKDVNGRVISMMDDYKGGRVTARIVGENLDNVLQSMAGADSPEGPDSGDYRKIAIEGRDSSKQIIYPKTYVQRKMNGSESEWSVELDIPENRTRTPIKYNFISYVSRAMYMDISGSTPLVGATLIVPTQKIPKLNSVEFVQPATYDQKRVTLKLTGENLTRALITDYGMGISGNSDGKVEVKIKGPVGETTTFSETIEAFPINGTTDSEWTATIDLTRIKNTSYTGAKEYSLEFFVGGVNQKDNLKDNPPEVKKIVMPSQLQPMITRVLMTQPAVYNPEKVEVTFIGERLDKVEDSPSGDKKIIAKAKLVRDSGDSEPAVEEIAPVEVQNVAGAWKAELEVPTNRSYNFDRNYKIEVLLSGNKYVPTTPEKEIELVITVPKQKKPTVTSVQFTSPADYHSGSVNVELEGNWLDNVVEAPSGDKQISISATLVKIPQDYPEMPNRIDGVVATKVGGKWQATLDVPMNKSYAADVQYRIDVSMSGFAAEGLTGNIITVKKQPKPVVKGFDISSTKLKAADEDDYPEPTTREFKTFEGGTVEVVLSGENLDEIQNAPSGDKKMMLKAELKRKPGDAEPGSDVIGPVEMVKDGVTGKWKGNLTLPANNSFNFEKHYDLSVKVSGFEQPQAVSKIIVPLKYQRKIVKFEFEGQQKPAVIDHEKGTIEVVAKLGVNLRQINPQITLSEDTSRYEPADHHDFTKPVEYTITSVDGFSRKYMVTIKATHFLLFDQTKEVSNKRYVKGIMQKDGSMIFAPEKGITRAEVAQLIANISTDFETGKKYAGKFADVGGDEWFADAVNFAAEKGIIKGKGENKFAPMDNITREEFAAMVIRYAGIDVDKFLREKSVKYLNYKTREYEIDYPFTDIKDTWASEIITALHAKKWSNGYKSGEFKPKADITRAEAVKILNSVLGLAIEKEYIDTLGQTFTDVDKSHWAFYDIMTAANDFKFNKKK